MCDYVGSVDGKSGPCMMDGTFYMDIIQKARY